MTKLDFDRELLLENMIRYLQFKFHEWDQLDVPERIDEYANEIQVYYRIKRDEYNHYVSFSQEQPTKISFASKIEYKYDNAHRTCTTLGKYIRKHLGIDCYQLPDNIMNHFVQCVISGNVDANNYITLLEGKEIPKAYDDELGGHSCMTGVQAYKKLKMYEENPDKIKLLKYDDGSTQARALFWTTDAGEHYIDRIYPSNCGLHNTIIQDWASKNNYLMNVSKKMEVTLKRPSNDMYPYMDTFRYLEIIDDSTIKLNNSTYADYELTSTEGYLENEHECSCCGDRNRIGDDYFMYDGEYYCESCYQDRFFYCARCEQDRPIDDSQEVDGEVWCSDCAERYAAQCSDCGEYTAEWEESENCTYCRGCAREHQCEICYKYIDVDETLCEPCKEQQKLKEEEDECICEQRTNEPIQETVQNV